MLISVLHISALSFSKDLREECNSIIWIPFSKSLIIIFFNNPEAENFFSYWGLKNLLKKKKEAFKPDLETQRSEMFRTKSFIVVLTHYKSIVLELEEYVEITSPVHDLSDLSSVEFTRLVRNRAGLELRAFL